MFKAPQQKSPTLISLSETWNSIPNQNTELDNIIVGSWISVEFQSDWQIPRNFFILCNSLSISEAKRRATSNKPLARLMKLWKVKTRWLQLIGNWRSGSTAAATFDFFCDAPTRWLKSFWVNEDFSFLFSRLHYQHHFSVSVLLSPCLIVTSGRMKFLGRKRMKEVQKGRSLGNFELPFT